MKTSTKLISILCGLALAASCRPGRTYNFSGNVYDGATGKALTSYTMTVSWENTTVNASVDKTGRFYFAGLPSLEDYQVNITATGYRAFTSSNKGLPDVGAMGLTGENADPVSNVPEGFVYSAVLFPSTLKAPATEIDLVAKENNTAAITGTLRLTPSPTAANAGGSTVGVPTANYNQIQTTPTSGVKQVWGNDLDTAAATITKDIANGKVSFTAGELVYGVAYTAAVLGAGDYKLVTDTTALTAGVNSVFTLTLTKAAQTLAAVYCSTDNAQQNASGFTFTVVFNQNVVQDPTQNPGTQVWNLDNDVFGTASTHANTTSAGYNYLPPPVPATSFTGCVQSLKAHPTPDSTSTNLNSVSISVQGNVATITVGAPALDSASAAKLDPACVPVGFTFNQTMLDEVSVAPASDPTKGAAALSSFSCPSYTSGTIATHAPIFVRTAANP